MKNALKRFIQPAHMCAFTIAFICAMATSVGNLWAEGTEELGPAQIEIEEGSSIIYAGVGMGDNTQPGDITIEIPEGNTVKQVVLYWIIRNEYDGNLGNPDSGDDTIEINGVEYTGSLIGGPAFYVTRENRDFQTSTFRLDISALGLVGPTPGTYTFTVGGLDGYVEEIGQGGPDGAGIAVVLDDGSPADLRLNDGNDFAFLRRQPPQDTTSAVEYFFDAEDVERIAKIGLLVGDTGADRDDRVWIDVDGERAITLVNELAADAGPCLSIANLELAIPAGATSVSVQVISGDGVTLYPNGASPDSLVWGSVSFSLPVSPPLPPTGSIGDTVFYDENDNGVQDDGEAGIAGAVVNLTLEDGTVLSAMTDGDGNYLFVDVPAGMNTVEVEAGSVADLTPGQCGISLDVDLAAGEDFLDADFCFVSPPEEYQGCPPNFWLSHPQHWSPTGIWFCNRIGAFFDLGGPYRCFKRWPVYCILYERSYRGRNKNRPTRNLKIKGRQLLRQGVAALLNAGHPDVNYPRTSEEIIQQVNEALDSCDPQVICELIAELEHDNNLGCSLDTRRHCRRR